MGQSVQIVITGDVATGSVNVQGLINDMRIVHWLLGEARRACEKAVNQREAAKANGRGPDLIIAPAGAVPPHRG